jgi:hypothetical protein
VGSIRGNKPLGWAGVIAGALLAIQPIRNALNALSEAEAAAGWAKRAWDAVGTMSGADLLTVALALVCALVAMLGLLPRRLARVPVAAPTPEPTVDPSYCAPQRFTRFHPAILTLNDLWSEGERLDRNWLEHRHDANRLAIDWLRRVEAVTTQNLPPDCHILASEAIRRLEAPSDNGPEGFMRFKEVFIWALPEIVRVQKSLGADIDSFLDAKKKT